MSNEKKYALKYSHQEIQEILDKVYNGYVLKEKDYKKLFEMGIDNISTFSGDYNDLINKPDLSVQIYDALKAENLPTNEELESKLDKLISAFNSCYEDIERNIRTDMATMEIEIYEAMGEEAPDGTSYNERIKKLEEENAQLTASLQKVLSLLEQPPVYSKPTMSLGINPARVIHKQSTTVTITPTFSSNDAGEITSYVLKKGDQVLLESPSIEPYEDTIALNHSSTLIYTATISYADGPIKDTNIGNPYPSTSIKAGSISSDVSIRGYAYSYYGVIDTDTVTEEDIKRFNKVQLNNRANTVTYNLQDGQRSVYMYPSNYGLLTSIKDINNFSCLNSYEVNEIIYDGIAYNVYMLIDPVMIDGFKQIFS